MAWLGDHSWLAVAVFWALLIGGGWGSLGFGWLQRRGRRGDHDR